MPIMQGKLAAALVGIATTALLAAGCAGARTKESRPADTTALASSDVGDSIALLALSMIGVQYRYGGAHPREGFDCSGLVYYAYASNGLSVPRTSQDQFTAARKIPLAQAAAGDLLFFQDQENLSHVGIYLGDGRFVHAPSSGDTVRIARIEAPYYQRHLVAIGRLLP
jgi:cell wall-associated NlpC family hydrolase